MDIQKVKENSVKAIVIILNLVLAVGGVFYFKNKDKEKKEEQISSEQSYNEDVAKYEMDQIQSALTEVKIQKEESVANNPETVTSQKTEVVKKTYPAVTKEVTVQKPTKSTSSS